MFKKLIKNKKFLFYTAAVAVVLAIMVGVFLNEGFFQASSLNLVRRAQVLVSWDDQSQTVTGTFAVLNPPPAPDPSITLTASQTSITYGDSVTLNWTVKHVKSCSSSHLGSFAISTATNSESGNKSDNPTAKTTYKIDCDGDPTATNPHTSQSITVTVEPKVTLAANPTTIISGNSSKLTWILSPDVKSCTRTGSGFTSTSISSGNQDVSPTAATTTNFNYNLTCKNNDDISNSAEAIITVNPAPPSPPTPPAPLPNSADEVFTQNSANNKADIIWVVDNSGSMYDDQDALKDNAAAFINNLTDPNNKIDYKIGITTVKNGGAEANTDGLFVGAYPILDPNYLTVSNIINYFKSNVLVGISQSVEQGLVAAAKAAENGSVSAPQKWGTTINKNYGFLRSDAWLIAIIVSDENDQSCGSTMSYINRLRALKANPKKVVIDVVVDTSRTTRPSNINDSVNPNCGTTSDTLGSDRYQQAATETGGLIASIFNSTGTIANYQKIMDLISNNIADLASSFTLKNKPIVSTIKVTVNGTVIAQGDNGWTYNELKQAIVFVGSFVPPSGATIHVTYNY